MQLGYFHRTYNPPISFPDTLRSSDDAPFDFPMSQIEPAVTDDTGMGDSEQAAGVRGNRESCWRSAKQGQSASLLAEVKGQPRDAIEQLCLERRILLYDEFEISSYASSFAGASTSRCHGTTSLATSDLVSPCPIQQRGLSCSQVSAGTANGHSFTPRMYYESDSIYQIDTRSRSPRVFHEFQGLRLEMAAARRVCHLLLLASMSLPATNSPTAASRPCLPARLLVPIPALWLAVVRQQHTIPGIYLVASLPLWTRDQEH